MIATRWLTVSDHFCFRRRTARPTSTPRCPDVPPGAIVVLVTSGPRPTAVWLRQLLGVAEKSPGSAVLSRPSSGVKSAQAERMRK